MPQMTDTIQAKPREAHGKGAAHKLRKAGAIPAIVYGPGTESRFLALDPLEFGLQRQQFGLSHIFDVKVDGGGTGSFKALIREIQIDPVSQKMMHVDLYALDMAKPVRIEVLVELEGKPAGLLDGGILSQIMRRIEVECLPAAIPEKLTVDVSALGIGQSVKSSELRLPAGVKLVSRVDQAIAAVVAPQEEEAAPTAAGAVAEGAEGAAAAAPAEGAAAAEGAPAAAGADKAKGGGKAEGKEGKK